MKSISPAPKPPKIPRLDSLHHRLQHAKDAAGRPVPLIDELLFFLDDPPAGTSDRWQKGADLCAEHGIIASHMAVWRFYRANIVQWRREQNPPPPEPAPDEAEIARLEAHARYLAVQRMIEMLNDPRLTPSQLIGILRNQNRDRQLELGRDQFNERVTVRRHREEIEHHRRIEENARREAQAESSRRIAATFLAHMGPNTPSQNIRDDRPVSRRDGALRSPTEGRERRPHQHDRLSKPEPSEVAVDLRATGSTSKKSPASLHTLS